jgi:hypothetical protein
MKHLTITLLTSLLLAANSFAFDFSDQGTKQLNFKQIVKVKDADILAQADMEYFKIEEVSVTPVETPLIIDTEIRSTDPSSGGFDLGAIIAAGEKIIAFGKKVWEIVSAGKPSSTVNSGNVIHVLPQALAEDNLAFYSMSGWSMPKAKSYKVDYKNGWGSTVVSFVYTVVFQHSGMFEEKGQYLTGVKLVASNVKVNWGFSFESNVSLQSIANQGTLDSPVASAMITVNYHVSSIATDIKTEEAIFVNGRGEHLRY